MPLTDVKHLACGSIRNLHGMSEHTMPDSVINIAPQGPAPIGFHIDALRRCAALFFHLELHHKDGIPAKLQRVWLSS